ncbi:MAG: PTS ascorbate transporter subunit IIC [Fusobacteriaceae bacterium]
MGLLSIFEFFVNNILTKPEFFVGILVFIGYLLLKKPFYQAFSGFIKATVGYMILNVGAGGLVSTFRPILAGLNDRFGLNAAVIDPYFGLNAVNSALDSIGVTSSWTMIALLIGFTLNIVLVLFRKYTKIRTLFITGHIMVQQATTATWIIFYAFPQYRNATGAVMIGIFVGTYWAVSTNLTVAATQRLTDGAGFVIGHQQMFAIWATDKIAPKIGDSSKKLDDLKLPEWLSIFHDNIVATGTLMIIFFGTILGILGEEYMRIADASNFGASLNFVTYIVSKSLYFSVYLAVLMTGVRMFVSELTESFQGISNRILPGVMPAVDCAAAYGFGSQNAVLFGFLLGAVGQFVAIAGLLIFKSPILIITGFVPVFFDNATIAIFAEKRGGVKAAIILPFISGILQVLLGAVAVAVFKLQGFGGWHGNIDQSTVWLAQGFIMKNFGLIGFVVAILGMLAIPLIQYRKVNNHEHYFNNEFEICEEDFVSAN